MKRPARPLRASIGPDEEVIRSDELAELRKIRRAHDDYLAMTRWTLGEATRVQAGLERNEPTYKDRQYWIGWLDCLRMQAGALRRITRGEKL